MPDTLKYLFSIIVLLFIGLLISGPLFEFAYSEIENENIKIVDRNSDGQFLSHIVFALSIGITPLLYLIFKKKTKVCFFNRGLISYGIIIASGFSLWLYRILQLKNKSQTITDLYQGKETQNEFDFNSLHINNHNFEYYLLLGFIIGTILSIVIFRNLNKKVTE